METLILFPTLHSNILLRCKCRLSFYICLQAGWTKSTLLWLCIHFTANWMFPQPPHCSYSTTNNRELILSSLNTHCKVNNRTSPECYDCLCVWKLRCEICEVSSYPYRIFTHLLDRISSEEYGLKTWKYEVNLIYHK